jgi:hypothetical protein
MEGVSSRPTFSRTSPFYARGEAQQILLPMPGIMRHFLPSPGGQGDRLVRMLKLDLDQLSAG